MFTNHQPCIGEYAQSGPDGFEHVFQFVIATIQQPIEATPAIVQGFQHEGSESRDAWGMKGEALDWMASEKRWLYGYAMEAYNIMRYSAGCSRRMVQHFANYKGLGLVKGGFMAQLCFGVGGCIDSHNISRFSVPPRQFSASRYKSLKTAESREILATQYCNVIKDQGGCEVLWDGWCDFVAARRPEIFENGGYDVSALHCTALGLWPDNYGKDIPF